MALSTLDHGLLTELQERFPLSAAPFAELAARLGATEADVLERVAALHASGVIRHISPIFEAEALGYTSCLVAMQVPEDGLEAAAAAVSAHPGVSHNYRREHTFNLWFTIAVPPGADLDAHIAALHARAGASSTHALRALRRFKIGVSLDLSGEREMSHRSAPRGGDGAGRTAVTPLTAREIEVVRTVQGDLPVRRDPFAPAAHALGMGEEALVGVLRDLQQRGCLRRIAAILRHRDAGFGANGMAVWDVPDDQVQAIGEALAEYTAISHCYERPRYDDWPYNVFTMIHARDRAECGAFVEELARRHGLGRHAVLYSTREYKKVRPRYFTPDVAAWEREAGIR